VAAPATNSAPEATELTASTNEAQPVSSENTLRHEAATALAHAANSSTPQATATKTVETAAALPQGKLTHQARKALRQELRRQLTAPQEQAASGKSQLLALLLLIFLGGLGIHRFYLGYTGRGILYIALLLTSFLIVPAIALTVLLIIDLVRTITGSLKPKNGEYAKTL